MAAAAPETAPTFNWTGMGRPEGAHIHYQSFNFAGQHYSLGDCVYLLPEEEGSPPYIARLVRAYEDANAKEAERLVIEVQWFERRGSLPASVAATMHELEVVESDLLDTNLVGCLDSKATIIQANSYEEACAMLPQGHTGDWHFCRGVWETEKQAFKSYTEYGCYAGAAFGQGAAAAMYQQYQQAALNGYPDLSDQDFVMEDDTADLTPRSGGGRGRGGRSRRSTSARASAAANVAAATAAAAAANGGGGYHRAGIPGKVCCECGATQTPQWREGPKGPKTLCNACGVRYQRQQSKAKSNKRQAADRSGGKERGSSPAPHGGGRGNKAARLAAAAAAAAAVAASAGNTPDAAAAAAAAVDDAFSAAALESQQLQMAQLLNGGVADAAAAAAAAAAPPAHHHGTRRNSKAAAAAAATGESPRAGAGSRGRRGSGHSNNADAAAAASGGAAGAGGPTGKGAKGPSPLCNSSSAADAAAAEAGAGGAAGGKGKGHGHPALAAAVAAAGEQLGYYADERSPPNSNTRILEYEEQEDAQQNQGQQNLARSNTHEAADALQDLAKPSKTQQQRQQQQGHSHAQQDHEQQQGQQGPEQQQQQGAHGQQAQQAQAQQHPQHAAAAAIAGAHTSVGFFSALGSPATALLIAEQGMPSDSMPLLSLDDKYRPGTPSGLGVPDGLDGINPHSLSPLKPRTAQQLLSGSAAAAAAAAGAAANLPVGRDGSTTSMPRYGGMGVSGPGAVCASPGRLISAMVQNLKLPAPLALHPGLSPLGAVTSLGMPSGTLSQQQQHQPHGGMLSDLLAGTGAAVGEGDGGSRQQQQAGDGGGGPAQRQPQLNGIEGGVPGGAPDSNDNRLLTQLRGLLYRASSYTPDVSGLSGLYPGPSTPRSLQQLVDQLEGLPESSKAQLQQVSAAIEDSLSKAKAAEAAVLAVTQVLATKQAAEAEAKASVEEAVLQLRTVLSQLHPDVAAAAAGNGRGFSSAAATPTAADAAVAGGAAVAAAAASDAMASAAMTTSSYLRQSYPLSNGAGGMLGLAEGVGHPYGPAAAIAQGPLTLADTDDLLRDPDDVPGQQQQHQMLLKQEPAAAGDGVLGGSDLEMQDVQQQDGAGVKQEAAANGDAAAAPAAPVAAAAAAPAAAESAPVAA